jgi:hypothetical protein
VEKLTWWEHNHPISSATSSGRPKRRIGVKDCERSSTAGSVWAFIGVATAAGATAFTSTPVAQRVDCVGVGDVEHLVGSGSDVDCDHPDAGFAQQRGGGGADPTGAARDQGGDVGIGPI